MDEIIADILRNDTLSIPASTYVERYPDTFTAASAVPTHFYTCLKDIWVSSSLNDNVWATYIISSLGMGEEKSNGIEVFPVLVCESVDHPNSMKLNIPGAKYAEIEIHLKIPAVVNINDRNKIRDAGLRIERLIDFKYRNNICREGAIYPDPSIDNTLHPDYPLKIRFLRFVNVATRKELSLLFSVDYVNLFLR